jgi:predicted phage terminase large subunit-like protein
MAHPLILPPPVKYRDPANPSNAEKVAYHRRGVEHFLKYLCTSFMKTPHWSKVHDDLQYFMLTADNRIHIELPRGHLKSHVVTKAWAIQEMLKNPNIRVLIVNAVEENAVKMVRSIEKHLARGGLLSQLYGAFESDIWNQNECVVRQRTEVLDAPTFMGAGLQKTLTSQHFDVIIADDLVEPDNSRTKEQRDKVYDFYLSLFDLLEPGGKMVVIGTRYHQDDLYAKILEDHKLNGGWDIFIRDCWEEGKVWEKPLFPEKFTVDGLRAIYNKPGGKYHFAAQYMNNPLDPESADFKVGQIRYYEPGTHNPGSLYLTVDPAISLNRDADYSAFVVAGMFGDRRIRVVDAIHKRCVPSDLVNFIFELVNKWGLHRMGIETFAFQKTLKYEIQRKQRETGKFFSIDELGRRNTGKGEPILSKEARIRRLQPLFEQGLIEIRRDHAELENELLAFPRGKHDDLIDALSYQLDYLVPSHDTQTRVVKEVHGSVDWWIKNHMPQQNQTIYEKFFSDLKR